MGKVLAYGLELIGTSSSIRKKQDSELLDKINEVVELASCQNSTLTPRELNHVKAIKTWSDGRLEDAAHVWEDILLEHPTDMHAIKMVQDTYFYLGAQTQMRDSIARVLPEWKNSTPLKSYLYGMYSFGLIETNRYDEGEKFGLRGLEENKNDGWATHALAHYYEMTGKFNEGIRFLDSTLQDWQKCNFLSCHTFWHWAVYFIEKNEPESALNLFETKICPSLTQSGAMLDYIDASSLLYRLQLSDFDVSKKWEPLCSVAEKHIDDHVLIFNDAHFLMAYLGNKDDGLAQDFMKSFRQFMSLCDGDQAKLTGEVGQNLFSAIISYNEGNYAQSADLLNSIKYKIIKIGGSNAQRDVFEILLLNAAVRANTKFHNKLARALLNERKAKRPNSLLTERILEKYLNEEKFKET